jgi:hypothetical protein
MVEIPKAGSKYEHYYPFFKMDFDATATIRFVTDTDETNQFGFYREHLTHELYINGKKRIVPCLSMYGKPCPCCELSQQYYKAEGKESVLGKKYWRKKAYLTQAIVVNSPFDFDTKGNSVKILELGPKIFDIIKNAIITGDIDVDPDTLKGGYDFRLTKKKQGDYADYSLSKFAPRPSDVDAKLLEIHSPFNLSEFLTKEITAEKMEQLIEADRTGGDVPSDNTTSDQHQTRAETAQTILESKVQEQVAEAKAESAPSTETATDAAPAAKSAADILAQIKARAQASKS